MRTAKKIIWAIIAILPVLSIVVYTTGNIGNTEGVGMIPMGSVSITETAEGDRILSVEADTWGDCILTPLYGENAVTGLYGAVAGLCLFMSDYAGIPVSVPVCTAVFMLCYLAVIELLSLFLDFIMFVPRKCLGLFK